MSEHPPSPESKEKRIERLFNALAHREGMEPDHMEADMVMYAPHPDNEFANMEYIQELAEKLSISLEDMIEYANNVFERYNTEE